MTLVGIGAVAFPFLWLVSRYCWPPTVTENTEEGQFVIYTPIGGPDEGRSLYGIRDALPDPVDLELDADFVYGPHARQRTEPAAGLRPLTVLEFRKIFGNHYVGEASEFSGQGNWSYDFKVEGDVFRTMLEIDNDKYRWVRECAYRVEGKSVRFLRRRISDHSWPDRRD